LRALAPFLPPWATSPLLRRNGRYWGGDARSGLIFAPFTTLLEGYQAHRVRDPHPADLDWSTLRAGAIEGPIIRGLLFGGEDPILRPRAEVEALGSGSIDVATAGPVVSLLVLSHTVDPMPREAYEVDAASARAVEVIADSYRTFLSEAGRVNEEKVYEVAHSPAVRRGIWRAAQARARLTLRSELLPADILEIGRSFADSVATITYDARVAELRWYLVSEDLESSQRERDRRDTLESAVRNTPGISPDELWQRLERRGLRKARAEFDRHVYVLIERGFMIESQGGLYWVE
jgi:hypothetical protein